MKMLISRTELDSKKSRDMIPLECMFCGNTHNRPKNVILRILNGNLQGTSKGCYCSKECGHNHRRNLQECNCKVCGEKVERNPSQMSENIFCSSSCSATYSNKNRTQWNNCLFCHSKIYKHKTFCSRKCQQEFRKEETYRQIENGNYKCTYSGNTILKRYLILKRMNQCEDCKSIKWNGKTIPLTTHHIDGDASNNLPSNLRLLCWNCHALTENYGKKNLKSARIYRYGAG